MNKFDINPLFLLMSTIVILMISIISLNKSSVNKNKNIININKNIEIINKYNSLKNTWINAKKQESLVNNIIKQQKIRNANILINKDKIKVIINSNPKVLHRVINKLLNKKINIIKLKLSKNQLVFEVGLL